MATETEDTAPTKPAENKCEEADEPGSPTDKEKQLSRKSKSNSTMPYLLYSMNSIITHCSHENFMCTK